MDPQSIYLNVLQGSEIGSGETIKINKDYDYVESLGDEELDTLLEALENTSNLILNKQGLYTKEVDSIINYYSMPI